MPLRTRFYLFEIRCGSGLAGKTLPVRLYQVIVKGALGPADCSVPNRGRDAMKDLPYLQRLHYALRTRPRRCRT